MEHNLDQTIALLARTPATLDALLRDLPAAWTLENEGPGHLERLRCHWPSEPLRARRLDAPRPNDPHPSARPAPSSRWTASRSNATVQGSRCPSSCDEFTQLRAANLLRPARALRSPRSNSLSAEPIPPSDPVTLGAAPRHLGRA